MQGAEKSEVEACRRGECPEDADPRRAELWAFARKLTLTPGQVEQGDIARLREAGWADEEIAEAVYTIALFAFFNRVASAFGLEDPRYEERLAAGDQDVPPRHQPTPEGL